MAGAKRVTQEDVDGAAEALLASGKDASVTGVREVLGRGSYSTIGQMLALWRAGRAAAPGTPAALPDPLARAVSAYLQEAVGIVQKASAARLTEEEQARSRAEKTVDTLEGRIAELELAVEELRNEREQARGRAAQLQDDLASERANNRAAEQRANDAQRELAAALARLEAANARAEAAEQRERDAKESARVVRDAAN
jgi:hypothetical protein